MSQDLSKPVIRDRVFLGETNSVKIRGLFTRFCPYLSGNMLYFFLVDNEADLGKTAQYLIDSCKPGSTVCLICIASIKHVDAVSIS